MVHLKTEDEITTMRAAGKLVASLLAAVSAQALPGVRLVDLDALASEMMAKAGATSSFRNYHPSWAPTPYPGVLCLSVNEAIVHGIPDHRALKAGDLLSVDCGAALGGYHGDSAVTVTVGDVDEAGRRLSETTARALAAGIAAATVGARIGDISHAIETVGRTAGYGIPSGFGGHGIGTEMHEDPGVPNTGRPHRGLVLREGLVIAIEPMLIESGRDRTRTLSDGWTFVTADGSRAAHFEHTVAITAEGPVVLTAP